jgi:hypothetical protein
MSGSELFGHGDQVQHSTWPEETPKSEIEFLREDVARLTKLNDKYAKAIYRLEQQLKKAEKR